LGKAGKVSRRSETLRVEYDKDLDTMYIRLKEGKYAFSEEINENALLDLDPQGKILAIEIRDVSDFLGEDLLQKTLKAEEAVLT
jgi:uncharacterized protein YuzE